MKELARRIGAAILWLVLVAAIALGGAGLVSGMDHLPAGGARPELTAARDAEVAAELDAVSGDLLALGEVVAELGVQARGALAALNGTDTTTSEAAIEEGDRLIDRLLDQTRAIRLHLADVPYVARTDTLMLISPAVVARHSALARALDATDGLQGAWARLTSGSLAAIGLSTMLARHDEQVADAAAIGREGRYSDAVEQLAEADATIEQARALRNQLANTVDVTVLDEWLNRNAAYDVALADLYRAYARVGNTVTEDLRDAIAAEAEARQNLPPDTRGLVVIMAELGRGGMNSAVVAIEQARGRLIAAIDAAG
jgi:hypothetical protein